MEEKALVDLEKFLGAIVIVSVKGGRKFRGKFTRYDAYMNLVLEDAEEISDDKPAAKHKLIMIKGGNVSAISIST